MEPTPYQRLRAEVAAALDARGLSGKGGGAMGLKAALVLLNWGFWYALALHLGAIHPAFALAASLPLAISFVVVMCGLMHDGSHGAASEHPLGNRLLQWTLVAGGASAISWHQEHVLGHHMNTNVLGDDSDLASGGWLRFHDGQPWRPIHRYQHWYAWLLYGLVALKWAWYEDFEDVLANWYGMTPRERRAHLAEVALAKVSHVGLFMLVPCLAWGWPTALAFYLMHFFLVGLAMASTFVLAHLSGVQEMPHRREEAPQDWALFQVATSANFATANRLLTWLTGGLNHQVEHHLFPAISHRHYPLIQPIVRRWAAEHGVAYHEFPTVAAAIRGHLRHLAHLGRATTAAGQAA